MLQGLLTGAVILQVAALIFYCGVNLQILRELTRRVTKLEEQQEGLLKVRDEHDFIHSGKVRVNAC